MKNINSVLEPHKALETLLKDHVYKYKNFSGVTNFRMKQIFTRGIDNYIKKNDLILRNFYNTFIHGVKNYFTSKDALEMCLRVKLKISEKSVNYAYSWAKQSVLDPVKDPLLLQKMYYPEFLVFLCGIANEYFKDDIELSHKYPLEQKLHLVLQELMKKPSIP